MQITNSSEFFSRAKCRILGGVNSPVRAFKSVNMTPLFIKEGLGSKILDADGNQVAVEQSKIDAARVELNAEYEKIKYKEQRLFEYPSWADQLDYIYHNGIDKWKTDIIDPIKKKYPKPE